MYYELTDQFEVSATLEKTWQFFATAKNLSLITPRSLAFTVAPSTPTTIQLDTILDYTIQWMGLPIKWRTKIIDFSPPRQFIDLQIRGPYALWHHQHWFSPNERGVICNDRVIYKLPIGPIGQFVHALSVRRQLLEIFRYRRNIIGQHLGGLRPIQNDVQIEPLK